MKFPFSILITLVPILHITNSADDDYNTVHKDGSFEFGYNTPDSYHYADGNRNNVVRGEFGGRNPKTGAIDSTVYTAGPRGYRPRGKNIVRKYDLNQAGPLPIGSPDDPYFDPYEDPSYNFEFHTRGHSRQESANRLGNVNGKYSYLDDIGERHNVEYIAGKNIGFHVKTPYPDSNPRAYGPLYFNGIGKPLPRGRTSIQRGQDGSYRFVSAGPDQRRTETSDSTGHVRGSYTYLDDKGIQHSVHYIAGPETGYRVLKNVKGPHLPTVYPFGRPDIIPPDFYDYTTGPDSDVFDTAASGRPVKPRPKPSGGQSNDGLSGETTTKRPGGSGGPFGRPGRPTKPSYDYDDGKDDNFGDLFGGSGGGSTTRRPVRPGGTTPRPGTGSEESGGSSNARPGSAGGGGASEDSDNPDDYGGDFGLKPGGGPGSTGGDQGSSRPGGRPRPSSGNRPGFVTSGTNKPSPSAGGADDDDLSNDISTGLFGSETGRPSYGGGYGSGKPSYGTGFGDVYGPGGRPSYGGVNSGGRPSGTGAGGTDGISSINIGGKPCPRCQGTIVTNVGDRLFTVPPGVSVRAHVQSIDLLPVESDVPSPGEQLKKEARIEAEPLHESPDLVVAERSGIEEKNVTTTAIPESTTAGNSVTTTTEKEDKDGD